MFQLPKLHQDTKIQRISQHHKIWTSLTTSHVGAMKMELVTGATLREDTPLRTQTRPKSTLTTVISMAVLFIQEMVWVVEVEIPAELDNLLQARLHTTKQPNPRLARSTLTSLIAVTLVIRTEKFIKLISNKMIRKISKNRFKINCQEFKKYSKDNRYDRSKMEWISPIQQSLWTRTRTMMYHSTTE